MRFWDSSALASLVLDEAFTDRAHELWREDDDLLVWWASEIEVASAIRRSLRAGRLPPARAAQTGKHLTELAAGWREVPPIQDVRREARRILALHPLRAAEALQLAAASVAAGRTPSELEFVCFDQRLASAAEAEGFVVLRERA